MLIFLIDVVVFMLIQLLLNQLCVVGVAVAVSVYCSYCSQLALLLFFLAVVVAVDVATEAFVAQPEVIKVESVLVDSAPI